ncbi:glycosyltransferase [Aeromicrobium fastidiosum]|uniref:Glycosyltransferase n=1 Tax=Aeromicrobium fastidiosum TaxID=52699 RepID=A0A641ARV1_9ACTN|nr:glycosyltransferase [Aeromicrobium fastidiosum]KAA1380675.1 glycosyltransferase [Aeromicrobium fastidiosum]MBP2390286.1 GT2 family glycosyltransferase [Aeromicrobium fastidiosum]
MNDAIRPGSVLVVLPTLGDRIDYLRETLATVEEQRKDVDLTLVAVMPGSATEAREIAKAAGAVVVDDPRTGISEAINAGLRARTTEEFYAWIGDDDLFRPGGLIRLQELLTSDSAAVLAYGGCDYIDPVGRTLGTSRAGRAARWLLAWGPNLIPHPGTMVRLNALEAIDGFDTRLKYAMDLDAFLRLRPFGRFLSTRETVSAFRWHPDSLTVAGRKASGDEAEAIKRRHLPAVLQPLSPLWMLPWRWASVVAARQVTNRARRTIQ